MKKNSVVLTAVLYGVAAGALAHAQAPAAGAVPTKIAVVNLADSLQRTKEGQKSAIEMGNKYGPKQAEYNKRQAEIEAANDRLNKGRATLSEAEQTRLAADIAAKTKDLKRYGEDTQAEMEADEAKIGTDLQTKMGPILQAYAIQNNFAVVLDIGNQQSPVLWFATATNITDALIAIYDAQHPVKEDAAAPKTPAPAAKAPAAAPKTPAAPPKKQ